MSLLIMTINAIVPVQVSYALFWQRYFYHAWKIDQDEQKRQLIVQGADEAEDDADFKWDSDEEDSTPALAPSSSTATITKKEVDAKKAAVKEEEEEAKKSRISSSSNSEDTDDFSNISESPTMKSSQTEDEWVKAEKKKSDEEDSDSDWE